MLVLWGHSSISLRKNQREIAWNWKIFNPHEFKEPERPALADELDGCGRHGPGARGGWRWESIWGRRAAVTSREESKGAAGGTDAGEGVDASGERARAMRRWRG